MKIRTLTPEEESEIIRRFSACDRINGHINARFSLEEWTAKRRRDLANPDFSADARAEIEREIAANLAAKEKRGAAKPVP
jgi:hypothetical protein